MNAIRATAGVLVCASLAACAGLGRKPLIDPFPLRFPLVEAGQLPIDGHISGQPWAKDGILHYRTGDGRLTAVVVSSRIVLSRSGPGPSVPDIPCEPGGLVLLRDAATLRAVDGQGRTVWEFKARGTIAADPAAAGGRVFFGDSERMFYCLKAANGQVKWRRRLQGAALHPAVVGEKALIVAAANSVVYRISRGGSILSWEAVPSRILYDLAAAGPLVLVSSATPTVTVFDLRTGAKAGSYEASGPLVAGAVWSPPYVALFVEDEASGLQRIVFLRSR